MTPEQVLAAVRDAVAIVLELPAVLPQQRFAEDLSADSLALVEILDILEERLAVTIADQDVDDLSTVQQLVDYILTRPVAAP